MQHEGQREIRITNDGFELDSAEIFQGLADTGTDCGPCKKWTYDGLFQDEFVPCLRPRSLCADERSTCLEIDMIREHGHDCPNFGSKFGTESTHNFRPMLAVPCILFNLSEMLGTVWCP